MSGATKSGQRGRARARRLLAGTAVVAALALTAACGGSDDGGGSSSSAKGAPITVWHGYEDVEGKAMQAAAADWNAQHPDQKVDLVFDGGNDSALQKTQAALAAGKYPDIAYEFGSSATAFVHKKQLVDLTKVVQRSGWNWADFYPGERAAATVDGKVVGLPALVDNLALVYNKKLFKQAGVAEPTPDWTWADFRAAAQKLTNAQEKRFGWAYVDDGSEDTTWRFVAMLWQSGGDLLSSDGKQAAFGSAQGQQAMQLLHDMAVTDKSVYLDNGSGNYLNLFNDGKIGMLWTGPWDLSSINEDVDYGVQVLPAGSAGHQSISGPDAWMVFDNGAARVKTAEAFLQWLLSPQEHLKWATATGDLPLRQSETTQPDYAKYLAKFPGDKVFVANQQNVTKIRPNIDAYPEMSAAIGQAVQAVTLGKSSPADALKSATDTANGLLAGSQ